MAETSLEHYKSNSEFRPSDSREIIHLIDREGCTGKSKFAKKIVFDHPYDVGVITYGTTSQINSSIVNLGPKKLYIIDLTRAKCKTDSERDLIAGLESGKNGKGTAPFNGTTSYFNYESFRH